MSKEVEEWRDIKGYEGLYQVSDWGRVKSLDHYILGRNQYGAEFKILKKGKIKKIFKHCTSRYYFTSLCHKSKDVHKLVAEAFIENPNGKPCVGHEDCNSENNAAWNLYWCTHEENNNHPITRERMSEGQKRFISNGGVPSFKGKHHTKESKKKISEALKGKLAGENNPMYGVRVEKSLKPVEQYTLEGEYIRTFDCVKDAAEAVKCSPTNISACCRGKTKTIKGYIWKYAYKV